MLNGGNEPSHITPARNRPIVIAYFAAGVMALAKQQRELPDIGPEKRNPAIADGVALRQMPGSSPSGRNTSLFISISALPSTSVVKLSYRGHPRRVHRIALWLDIATTCD
jgi:hypothetical protein